MLATQVFVSFQLSSSVPIELGYLPKSPVNNHLDTQPLATVFTVTVITLPAFAFNLHITLNDRISSFGTEHGDSNLAFELVT